MRIYLDILCVVQANSINSTGRVRLDLNRLKPSRIEFLNDPERPLTVPDGKESSPTWLEYVYRTAHPALRGCLTLTPPKKTTGRVGG